MSAGAGAGGGAGGVCVGAAITSGGSASTGGGAAGSGRRTDNRSTYNKGGLTIISAASTLSHLLPGMATGI